MRLAYHPQAPIPLEATAMPRFSGLLLVIVFLFGASLLTAAEPDKAKTDEKLAAARDKGLDWLTKNQAASGSWGKTYTNAVTGFACLSYLSSTDEPFTG